MPKKPPELGSLVSTHGTSPAFLQRATVIAGLSFLFFMSMLLVFYYRQQLMYFVLSTAFLVVYVLTMIGWAMQKRNLVSIHENGIAYRKFASTWDEIKSVRSGAKTGISIVKTNGETATIRESTSNLPQIAATIRSRLPIVPEQMSAQVADSPSRNRVF